MGNRLEEIKLVDRILTGISQGYKNEALIGDAIFKPTPVDRESDAYLVYGKEHFVDYGDGLLRPLRAKAKVVDNTISTDKYSCQSYALGTVLEDREIAESYYNIANDEVETRMEQIRLGRELLQAKALQDTANYSQGHKITLTTKLDEDSVDVISEIAKYMEVVRSSIGRYPNTLVLGAKPFTKIKNKSEIIDKVKYTQKGVITADLLASILEIKRVLVGKAVYLPKTKKAGTMADIWGNFLWLGFVDLSMNKKTPTFGRTFQKKGFPKVFKWREQPRYNNIEVEDIYDVKVTAKDAGVLVSDAVSD